MFGYYLDIISISFGRGPVNSFEEKFLKLKEVVDEPWLIKRADDGRGLAGTAVIIPKPGGTAKRHNCINLPGDHQSIVKISLFGLQEVGIHVKAPSLVALKIPPGILIWAWEIALYIVFNGFMG